MQELVIQPSPPEDRSPEPRRDAFFGKLAKVISHATALAIWLFVISKLFVYDIDTFLINTYFRNFSWVIEYKFFFVIAIGSIFLLLLDSKNIIVWTLFILFYPILVLLWYIPKFVLKTNNWMFLIALLNSLFSFFRSFRYNFTIFLIAIAAILSVDDKNALYILGGALTLLLGSYSLSSQIL